MFKTPCNHLNFRNNEEHLFDSIKNHLLHM